MRRREVFVPCILCTEAKSRVWYDICQGCGLIRGVSRWEFRVARAFLRRMGHVLCWLILEYMIRSDMSPPGYFDIPEDLLVGGRLWIPRGIVDCAARDWEARPRLADTACLQFVPSKVSVGTLLRAGQAAISGGGRADTISGSVPLVDVTGRSSGPDISLKPLTRNTRGVPARVYPSCTTDFNCV